jgi:hypothetical protein
MACSSTASAAARTAIVEDNVSTAAAASTSPASPAPPSPGSPSVARTTSSNMCTTAEGTSDRTGRGVGRGRPVQALPDQGALDLLDRLGDLDAARAGLGAVEGRAAAPHALLGVEDLQALLGALVAAVEDEPVRIDDGRGPKYCPSVQNTGHDVVQAAHRMHLVVSSKIARSSADCTRSFVGSLPVVIRNGITSR